MKTRIITSLTTLLAAGSLYAGAPVTITPGSANLSADTAANATTPGWTTLPNIVLNEANNGARDAFSAGANRTLILAAPAGFEFKTSPNPTVSFQSGRNITSASASASSSAITITLTVADTDKQDTLTISGIQARPTAGSPLTSGNITRSGGTAEIKIEAGTHFGTLTAVAGAAQQLSILTQPSSTALVDEVFAQQPSVRLRDQFGNNVTNNSSTIVTVTPSAGSLSGNTSVAAVNGVVNYSNLAATAAGTITLEFSSGSMTPVTSGSITVTGTQADPLPTQLVILTQPSEAATAGLEFAEQPVIAIYDQHGNLFTNESAVVTATRLDGAGDLQGTASVEVVDGVATFTNLHHLVAGDITIEFSAEGLSVTSETVTVSPNTATTLAFTTQPGSATFGAPFGVQPAVETQDDYGNPSTVDLPENAVITVSLFSGTGTLLGTTTADIGTAEGNGTVTFIDLEASAAGDKELEVTSDLFAGTVSDLFNVAKASQSITFGALADKTVASPAFSVSASASSQLPVSFEIFSGPATINGNTIILTGAGSVTVRASQVGDDNYEAAEAVDQSFTVHELISQSISFDVITDKTWGDAAFTVNASASSSLPVTLAVVSGPATIAGNTVTINGVGTVTIRASQAGNEFYSAAANFDRTFTVAKAGQTVTFAALGNKTFGDAAFTVSATASSGLTVNFSIVSGPATINGNSITITGAGNVTVRASQAGNDFFNAAAHVDRTFTVSQAGQTITFAALPDRTFGQGPFALSATASSGLPVTFTVVSGPATIEGSTLTLTGVGTVTVRASQAGNANVAAASDVDRTFEVQAIKIKADLNGDQKTDIFFQRDGVVGVWYMNGTQWLSGAQLRDGRSSPGWTVIGQADFTGDGKDDIAFQHDDGRLAIWEMNGTTFVQSLLLHNGSAAPAGWRAIGVCDFNNDNNPDILFQHTGGQVAIWLMDGLTVDSSILVRNAEAAAGWRISATGDFNGDSQADILVQNQQDGRLAIWTGENFATTQAVNNNAAITNGWRVAGAGHFNGDAHLDLLFVHTDGRLAIWLMNGLQRTQSVIVRDGLSIGAWRVVGPR
ncbi:MAG: FG-GAP-like repeat-containing protein [Limisphaerales bacterium]